MRNKLLASAAIAVGMTSWAAPAVFAQEDESVAVQETVIITGTRRDARSAADSPAPVDVVSGAELVNQGDNDVSNILRTSVPSYNVNT